MKSVRSSGRSLPHLDLPRQACLLQSSNGGQRPFWQVHQGNKKW
ncbi:hypothetical protein BDL97_13G010100 [Sphagnum fallax]|nr:hypothetical protein BDL97_13G010100 [Sphagnum fallax]